MTKELLIKFLNNKCSSKELEQVGQWIDENALNDVSKELAFNDWISFQEDEYSDNENERLNLLLDKIHHKININSSSNKPESKITYKVIVSWLTRIAAILLIPTLIYTFSSNSPEINEPEKYSNMDMVVDSLEILTSVGTRTIVRLTDGTEVHLNYGSKIKYPKTFDKHNREVTLSGEGFFDVAHDSERPFIVKTKQLDIKVLGTKFNVLTYPEDEFVATTLVEGKVVMEQSGGNGETKIISSLVPGQHVSYDTNTGAISSTTGNIDKYIAWKDGVLIFDNTGIKEVAEKLERNFNVEIQIANEIRDYTYTVKFVDESLFQILDLITKATPISYKILPREQLPDGTLLKQRILFEKR